MKNSYFQNHPIYYLKIGILTWICKQSKPSYEKELAEYRVLNIYLPEGYNKMDTVKYPVIYLLDDSANEDFIHIVGVGKEGKNVKVFFDYLPDENHATIMHEAVSNSFKLLYPVSTKD